MRPKVVLAIMLAAAVVLAVVVGLSKISRPQLAAAPVADTASVAVPTPAPAPKPALAVSPAPPVVTNNGGTNTAAMQKLAREEYIEKRGEELNELAMQTNSAAHQEIVAELKNPDRAIRKVALDALEQADDRSVVPAMQQIADQTDDPDDKQAIEDAINFINLPSLTEFLAQHKSQKSAAGNQPSQPSSPQQQQNNAQPGQ